MHPGCCSCKQAPQGTARADPRNHLLPQNIYNMGVSVLRILFISHLQLDLHSCCCCSCWQPLSAHPHRTFLRCEVKAQQVSWMSGTGWKAPGGRTGDSGTSTGRAGSGEGGPRQTLHKDSQGSGSFSGRRQQSSAPAGAGSSRPVLEVKNGTWCQCQNPSK